MSEKKQHSNRKNRAANLEFLARRRKKLKNSEAAQAALAALGIGEVLQNRFFLGLSELYKDTNNISHEDALIAPVIDRDGTPLSRSVYMNLQNVTVNPLEETFWSRGDAQTYHSQGFRRHGQVIVCSDLLEVWSLSDFLNFHNVSSEFLVVCSSNTDEIPEDWKNVEFWAKYENIYLAYPNDATGDKNALKAARIVNLPVKRLRLMPKLGKSWREFTLNHEISFDDFEKMLSAAKPIGADYGKESNQLSEGRFGYQPVDIAGSYHNGHLYYPVQTTRNEKEEYTDEQGKKIVLDTSRKELVLIRSDRSIQHIVKVPAPRGTPPDERLLKLSDGTLIEAVPKASLHATWAWESIYAFHKNKSKTRPLNEILADVKEYLTKNVWLPFAHDYDLLTLLVPVTFSQAIFKAVPLILVTGAPGSGKSALGRAMVNLCANAAMVGQISAAAVARLIDETKGFVVFDDLESIGRRKGRDAQFSDLVQALKLSYNRETSWKTWTDVSRAMSVKRINFFGVKMINNTTGADHILGSRVLKVFMRKLPVQARPLLDPSVEFDPVKLTALRNELHTWTFENVRLIDQTYQRIFPRVTDRLDEITAPLKVFAELSENPEMQSGLQRALEFQIAVAGENTDPVELLKEAVKRIVLEGYKEAAPTHILLEMKRLSFQKPAQLLSESQKWDDPAWVGRQLRRLEMVEVNSLPRRQFLHGKYLRIYPLRKESIDNFLDSLTDTAISGFSEPLDFCTECANCPYRTLDCPIMEDRLSNEQKFAHGTRPGSQAEYFN